jgi:hypothetical protein
MKAWLSFVLAVLLLPLASPAHAFCGFYVAQANTRLYNSASRVVLARKDAQTVVTMESNYQGAPSNFAMVIPVPTIIRRNQVRIADAALVNHIDTYSAPRLVEYFDPDPCHPMRMEEDSMGGGGGGDIVVTSRRMESPKALGVKIEARYQVGQYDILILSATQSGGLVTWLTQNGYTMPPGAVPVVGSYLRQNMKFFVAKVNLKRRAAQGAETLPPLQISYASRKFMLPIRLGTVNANGPQEMFVFTLTPNGRVETTNYRTVKLKSDMDIPIYVKGQFPNFYRATFTRAVAAEKMRSVFMEYAWDSSSCDPCSAEPLSNEEAKGLGASWAGEDSVYVTRLHLRYSRETFPEDLMLQETDDDDTFQARYVLRHPFAGKTDCKEGQAYRNSLVERWDGEARNLAVLTGWSMTQIKTQMRKNGAHPSASNDQPSDNALAALWDRIYSAVAGAFA